MRPMHGLDADMLRQIIQTLLEKTFRGRMYAVEMVVVRMAALKTVLPISNISIMPNAKYVLMILLNYLIFFCIS